MQERLSPVPIVPGVPIVPFFEDFQRAHRQRVEQGLENGLASRDDRWSEAIAVGSLTFVERGSGAGSGSLI